jgi:hypothetical protein
MPSDYIHDFVFVPAGFDVENLVAAQARPARR